MRLIENAIRAGLASVAFCSAGAALAAEQPLTMRDVNRMVRQHVPYAQIVDKASEQGIAFEVTPAVQNQLRRMGFAAEQIAALQRAFTPPAKPGKAEKGKADKEEPDEPIVPGQGLHTSDAQRDELLERIQKVNKASGAELQTAEARHTTLWAPKADLDAFLSDIKKLERFLETRCKEPLRSGLDKRAAHVVLLPRHYEFERWLKASFEILGDPFKDATAPGGTQELKKALLKGSGYVTPEFAVICLEDQQPDFVHRLLAADLGFMTFQQVVDAPGHEPLATGFANGLETFLMGSPTVLLFSNSYANINRDLGKDPRAWLHLVQQRINGKKVSSVRELLGMDTTNMLLPQYAEAWTLVGLLAKQPAKFAELVRALHAEKDTLAAIERIYGWDEKQLTEQWHKLVRAGG
jgi:hypothetical protein